MREVTPDEVHGFERDGVVCLRGLLPSASLEDMREPFDRAVVRDGVDMTAMARAMGETETATPGRFVAGIDHWREDAAFRAFAAASALPYAAAALMRSHAVWLYEDSILVKEPGTAEATRFHQDLAYFHVDGSQICTFWCPLDPVARDTGSLLFMRGSHVDAPLYAPNLFVSGRSIPGAQGDPVPDIDVDSADVICFDMEPGDVTVHHARTLHGALANSSPHRQRRAISVRYCGDDASYHLREGAPRKPHQENVASGDPLGGPDCPQVHPASTET
jgi:ectoine hydroxylase-related dioxygenase (phytanoyl-CoA dioxygenase family)